MKRLLATTALALGLAGPALADDVALVIGNGDYQNAPDADTAVRDATLVAEALVEAGWTVVKGTDLDRDAMRKAFGDFAKELPDADKVIIFYSGHAMRTGGETFLAPVDADASTLTDVLFSGVPLDLALQLAARKPGEAVIFVDGAQLRGFTPTDFVEPGLASLEAPEGVVIVSAAAPGRAIRRSRWRDSRFARLIVEEFLQPGESVAKVIDAMGGPTYHTGDADSELALVAEPGRADDPSSLDTEIQITYWQTAERSGKLEDYESYLRRYPEGFFVELARERIKEIQDRQVDRDQPQVDPAIEAENALNLSRIRKRRVQEFLQAIGFNPRGIDGIFGGGTRAALRDWQKARGYRVTGYLDAPQLDQLRAEGNRAIAAAQAEAERKKREAEAADNAFWERYGAGGDPDGLRTYLDRYPEGLHASEARAALKRIAEQEADATARAERRTFRRARRADTAEAYRDYLGEYPNGMFRDEALARLDEIEGNQRDRADRRRLRRIEDGLGLSQSDRVSVEQRLRALGYETGAQDGQFDRRTRAAISGYQQSRGIEPTGFLNRPTLVRLVRDTNQRDQRIVIDGADVIRGILDALTR